MAVLTLSTYSYVFLLSTESFSGTGRRHLEACLSLGVGPWQSFRRVALPMALPAIAAGVALSGMEVVNELGAVELLGVPTLSTGILERWQNEGDPQRRRRPGPDGPGHRHPAGGGRAAAAPPQSPLEPCRGG